MKKAIWIMALALLLLSGCGQQTESEILTTEPSSATLEASLETASVDEILTNDFESAAPEETIEITSEYNSSIQESTVEPQEETLGTVAEYDGCTVELQEAEFFTRDGQNMIRVYMTFTNNNSNGLSLFESFSIKAFQNDIEIEDCTDINDDELSIPIIREVKNGASLVGSYVFAISGTDDVEILVRTPTADEEVLAEKVYTYEAQDTDCG
jgi:outer membrane lipoprotein-sorting protein